MIAQFVLIALALVITFFILRKMKRQSFVDKDDGTYQIKFNEDGIELIKPDGQRQSVLWENLTLIAIRTTDQGPVNPDVFWQFYTGSEDPEIVFPQGAVGDKDLLESMPQRLAGFDYQEVIHAMGSTDNALFVIWSKPE